MPSIVTITVNPAIDKSSSVDALVPEKKLRCTEPVFEPGGGGINVSRAIRKLGGDAPALFLSGGANGKLLEHLLREEEVQVTPVRIIGNTRENLIILDSATGQQYRFGMPGAQVTSSEWQKSLDEISRMKDVQYLVASGSLSPGIPEDYFARLAGIAKTNSVRLVVDTSGDALALALKTGVYLIKPNLGELAFLAGKNELDQGEVLTVCRELITKGCSEIVVVSMGAAGAMLVTKEETAHIVAPTVKRKSTVGAGDSMVGGIIFALSKGWSLADAVRYGVASGTAATMNPGTQLCKLEDVNRLYPLCFNKVS